MREEAARERAAAEAEAARARDAARAAELAALQKDMHLARRVRRRVRCALLRAVHECLVQWHCCSWAVCSVTIDGGGQRLVS